MIHVENLTKYYDDFCAVDQISFDIQKGEILGLLGPNGAGKTTTLRMLTGYFTPSDGDIRIKGLSIKDDSLEIKKTMGYLPESAPIYHNMLVYDYLCYVASIRGMGKDEKISRIKQMTQLCGLETVMHKSVNELSKGYKQRVGLAHAMIHDPDILILDEPTSGLDPNQIVEIREIIRQIGKEKTIVFSTHILSEAEATCDRIIIINKGKIVADGDTESLKKTSDKEVLIYISLKDVQSQAAMEHLETISGVESASLVNGTGPIDDLNADMVNLKLKCRAENDIRASIYQSIKKTDWILTEFRQETKSLENIFRELTKEN